MFIALEAGIGLGAWLSAMIYANDMARIGWSFTLSAVLGIIALGYLLWKKYEV
jgi:predicted MFS family arabinose efflux permease